MLNRNQLLTFFLVNKRLKNTNKSSIVKPVMMHYFAAPYIQLKIQDLLHAAAYGDLKKVKTILKNNPGLLTLRCDTVDPAGNIIKNVTAYECALGAGDDEMAGIIGKHFTRINGIDGEKERATQYKNYEKSINDMLIQPSFDFSALLQIIIKAPAKDVTKALNLNFRHKSLLQDALEEFRKCFAPREIKNGEMHFNYANLEKALILYSQYFNVLKKASHGNGDKQDLFWRQVMGFIQRGLPACGRQAFAGGLYRLVVENKRLKRRFDHEFSNWKYPSDDWAFPITASDLSRSGLGYEHARGPWGRTWELSGWSRDCGWDLFTKLMSSKSIRLAELMQPHQQEKVRCVIC